MLNVFAVSDSTGETAECAIRAALVQYQDAPVEVARKEQVDTAAHVRKVVCEAASCKAIIVHTLASAKLRWLMLEETHTHGVEAIDLMGPLLDRLSWHLHREPQEKPGLAKKLRKAKEKEIAAVEYAFRHDDGHNSHDLERAEIVLAGISRSMKTPTMLYLAYRGWYTANVPLVPGIPPPESLLQFPKERVFCLFMEPEYLLDLRKVRAEAEGIPLEGYATLAQVRRELSHAKQLCAVYGWWRMDVTGKSVEEVGQEIIALASKRKAAPRTDA